MASGYIEDPESNIRSDRDVCTAEISALHTSCFVDTSAPPRALQRSKRYDARACSVSAVHGQGYGSFKEDKIFRNSIKITN